MRRTYTPSLFTHSLHRSRCVGSTASGRLSSRSGERYARVRRDEQLPLAICLSGKAQRGFPLGYSFVGGYTTNFCCRSTSSKRMGEVSKRRGCGRGKEGGGGCHSDGEHQSRMTGCRMTHFGNAWLSDGMVDCDLGKRQVEARTGGDRSWMDETGYDRPTLPLFQCSLFPHFSLFLSFPLSLTDRRRPRLFAQCCGRIATKSFSTSCLLRCLF